jgi:predicted ATPase/DNA-binding SARP family transcriptional activator
MQSFAALVRIFLFGSVHLEVKARSIALPQRESLLRLFVRLVLERGQPQSRKTLAFSLWPDETEASALANLRRHLYLLRHALPPPAQRFLHISSQTVVWVDSDEYWLDVRAFERDSDTIDGLEEIVSLYRGDLAAGVDGDDIILAHREELRRRYLHRLKRLIQACVDQNQLERALKWVRQLTAQDPWDEEGVRWQMTLEALTGNRAAALATYQTLARELEREMRTQPMPETMALYRDILNNRLPRLAPPKKTFEPYFISRADELAQLQNLLAALRNGQGGIVFISGEAGVGKTALVREAFHRFLESSDEDAPRLFWGHCLPFTGDISPGLYTPWRQIFASAAPILARSADIPSEWLNRLLLLVPDLSLLRPSLLAPSQPDAAELRAALRQSLRVLATQRPLVLVLEDVHWADAASLELVLELTDTCQTLPLLLLITHRTGETPAALFDLKRELRRRRCAQEISLRAFTDEASRLLLEKILGREALTPALWHEINRYAHGLPLLLREAAESLRKAREFSRRSLTLRQAIEMRLTQLTDPARQMLEAAAVLGFSFSRYELETMLGCSATVCATVLEDLQAQNLVREIASAGLDDYAFSHQLVHQIILDQIPLDRAVLLHVQAAHTLENVRAGQTGFAAEIAAHYEAAQQPVAAARFWITHAQALTDMAAFEQAEDALERAVALLGEDTTIRERRELRARVALQRGVIAHYCCGQDAAALSRLESALAACREFPSLYANALARYASALYTRDRYLDAHRAANQSLEVARTLGEKSAIARALNVRGIAALMMGRTHQAIQDLQEALALEEAANPSTQTVQTLNHLGTALVFVQDYAQAQQVLARTLELSRRGGVPRIESAALMMLGQIALNQGRYGEAIRLYSQAIEVAGASYLPGMWSKFAGRGAAFLRMGNLKEARQDFQHGLEFATRAESMYGQLLMRAYLTMTDLAQGRAPADVLAQLQAHAAALDLHPVVFLISLARAGLWRLLGEWQPALDACQRAIQAAQASGVPQFVQAAQLEELMTRALGEGIPDLATLESLSQAARVSGEIPQHARACLAQAAHLERQGEVARALLSAQRALTLARTCSDQPLIGESLLVLLRLHEMLGQTGQAQACRAEVRALAETAYAPLYLALDADFPLHSILRACL